jgi:hypothetical protein
LHICMLQTPAIVDWHMASKAGDRAQLSTTMANSPTKPATQAAMLEHSSRLRSGQRRPEQRLPEQDVTGIMPGHVASCRHAPWVSAVITMKQSPGRRAQRLKLAARSRCPLHEGCQQAGARAESWHAGRAGYRTCGRDQLSFWNGRAPHLLRTTGCRCTTCNRVQTKHEG